MNTKIETQIDIEFKTREGGLEQRTRNGIFFIKIVFGICIFRKSLGIFGGWK